MRNEVYIQCTLKLLEDILRLPDGITIKTILPQNEKDLMSNSCRIILQGDILPEVKEGDQLKQIDFGHREIKGKMINDYEVCNFEIIKGRV